MTQERLPEYTHPPIANSNLTHLYFKIADQKSFLSKLASSGLSPLSINDVVVTVVDPDGRKVMFGTA
jgi:hypothetical protein